MRIWCPFALHFGVFQDLDPEICKHEFWVKEWNSENFDKPKNVFILNEQQLNDPDEKFFDAILVMSYNDYETIKKYDKPIIFYHLYNFRMDLHKYIYNNKNVIPLFLFNSTRLSCGLYEGKSKTIMHGIDTKFWDGYTGEKNRIVFSKNGIKDRDENRFNIYKNITNGMENYILGSGNGCDKNLKKQELRDFYKESRVYFNLELPHTCFDTSCIQAMMTGMPIVSTDMESSGQFIRNGIEGFISNDPNYLRKKLNDLLNDKAMAIELGKNARKMATMFFDKKIFNNEWNDFLDNLELYLN